MSGAGESASGEAADGEAAGGEAALSGEAPSGGQASGQEASGEAGEEGLAAQVISLMAQRGLTLAVAESLTGGLLGAAVTAVPGASAIFRGGIIAYATDLKAVLLGVPLAILDVHGTVDPEVAVAMAEGARERLGADVAVSTTGVAGPDPVDGKPPGTVHVAVVTENTQVSQVLTLQGDRAQIRESSVTHALRLLWRALREERV